MRASERPVIGIDIGGTKIAAAVVDADGSVLGRRQIATDAHEGPERVLARLTSFVGELAREHAAEVIGGLGVGCPGPLDARAGVIQGPPNLPGWHDVPLVERLRASLGLPTFLENDANLAALAEHRFGAGRGARNLVYVTVSTGIGAGVIIEDALYLGANGNAGELGHVSVDYRGAACNCGNRGCLEAIASGTAIAASVRKRIAAGERSSLSALSPERIDGSAIVEALRAEDALARAVWDDAMLALGTGVANIINAFNPERVILGGGLTHAGDLLFDPVRRVALARAMPPISRAVTILPAALGGDVGVLGAAALAMARIR